MLQLHHDNDMGALEALVTHEVVEKVVVEVEEEVVAIREVTLGAVGASRGGVKVEVLAQVLEVVEIKDEDVDESKELMILFLFFFFFIVMGPIKALACNVLVLIYKNTYSFLSQSVVFIL